jgi:nucleoid-associated protein YgaU
MGGEAQAPEDQGPSTVDVPADDAPVSVPGTYDSYTVQKGDSLWSIAAKPEVYGKASQWRRIFDANRDLLKTPDQVRQGMTLKIPRGEPADDSTTYEDEGITYKK